MTGSINQKLEQFVLYASRVCQQFQILTVLFKSSMLNAVPTSLTSMVSEAKTIGEACLLVSVFFLPIVSHLL